MTDDVRPFRRRSARAVGAGLLVAAGFGALWALVDRQSRQAERRHPPVGRFVSADGVRLHLVERGRGRPVVLLHGAGSLLQDFLLSIFGGVAARHRAIALDRPGYGYSDRPGDRAWTPEEQADALRSALRRLGAERPIIVGHSWGCLVALAYALRHPEDAAGLVLMSGYCYPQRRLDAVPFRLPALPVIGPPLRHTFAPLLGAAAAPGMIRAIFAPNPVPPAFDRFPVALALRPGQLRADGEELRILRPAAARLAPRYPGIRTPTAILAGGADRMVDPRAHALPLHRDIAGSTLRVVPATGHMIHHIRRRTVLETIDDVARRAAAAEDRSDASGSGAGARLPSRCSSGARR